LFGNLALHFVRDNVYQRRVDISIKKLDIYGAFIGQLFIDGKDLGLQLIEKGLAKIHVASLRKLPFYNSYKSAYDGARERRIGLWEFHDFEEEERKVKEVQDQRVAQQTSRNSYPIAVTDVRSGVDFSFQKLSDEETSALEGLSASLQSENFSSTPPYTPKLYEVVAAQFTVDDLWYRAEILADHSKKDPNNPNFDVRYLDYGNRETLTSSRIRQLPKEYIDLISPQAMDAKLYNLRAHPLDSEFGRDSMTALREILWDKVLYAEQVREDKPQVSSKSQADKKVPSNLYHLIVYEEKKDINKTLIRNGHVKVEPTRYPDAYHAALQALQDEAHRERLGIWQYGADPDDDEEERL